MWTTTLWQCKIYPKLKKEMGVKRNEWWANSRNQKRKKKKKRRIQKRSTLSIGFLGELSLVRHFIFSLKEKKMKEEGVDYRYRGESLLFCSDTLCWDTTIFISVSCAFYSDEAGCDSSSVVFLSEIFLAGPICPFRAPYCVLLIYCLLFSFYFQYCHYPSFYAIRIRFFLPHF